MSKTGWTVYFWPGLPQLWLDGAISGLLLAATWGLALNFLVLSSYLWVELLTPSQLWLGWGGAAGCWLVAAAVSLRSRGRRRAMLSAPAVEDLFKSAVSEYLKGHWYESEAILGRLLAFNSNDIEARLMWATLLRRTRRYAEAKAQLNLLERRDGAAKWREEIAREWQALATLQSGLAGWLNVLEPSVAGASASGPSLPGPSDSVPETDASLPQSRAA
jgi:hypothetical protein